MAARKKKKAARAARSKVAAKSKPVVRKKALARRAPSAAGSGGFVFTREDALRTGRICAIPGHARTLAQIKRELAAMPGDFMRTNVPPILLRRESEELLQRRQTDVPIFRAEEVPVTDGHFGLVQALSDMLPVTEGEARVAETAYAGYDEKEDSLAVELRGEVKKVRKWVVASGLSQELASLDDDAAGPLRLMDAAEAVVAKCTPRLHLIKPRRRVERHLARITSVVAAMRTLRASQAGEAGNKVMGTDELNRIKRMLLDVLRYVAAQGDALFDGDATRAAAYTLQHVNEYRNRTRKKAPKSDGSVTTISPPAREDTDG